MPRLPAETARHCWPACTRRSTVASSRSTRRYKPCCFLSAVCEAVVDPGNAALDSAHMVDDGFDDVRRSDRLLGGVRYARAAQIMQRPACEMVSRLRFLILREARAQAVAWPAEQAIRLSGWALLRDQPENGARPAPPNRYGQPGISGARRAAREPGGSNGTSSCKPFLVTSPASDHSAASRSSSACAIPPTSCRRAPVNIKRRTMASYPESTAVACPSPAALRETARGGTRRLPSPVSVRIAGLASTSPARLARKRMPPD